MRFKAFAGPAAYVRVGWSSKEGDKLFFCLVQCVHRGPWCSKVKRGEGMYSSVSYVCLEGGMLALAHESSNSREIKQAARVLSAITCLAVLEERAQSSFSIGANSTPGARAMAFATDMRASDGVGRGICAFVVPWCSKAVKGERALVKK
eukprot:1160623-Pelagomonas_calceolata.AAC.5